MLLAISLMAFIININAPGNPVDNIATTLDNSAVNASQATNQNKKAEIRHNLGLDQPVFYFSISSLADSDTLYRVTEKAYRENLNRLTDKYGNWEAISSFYKSCIKLKNDFYHLNISNPKAKDSIYNMYSNTNKKRTYKYSKEQINNAVNETEQIILNLLKSYKESIIKTYFNKLDSLTKLDFTNLLNKQVLIAKKNMLICLTIRKFGNYTCHL